MDPFNSNKINFTVHINNAGDSATVVSGVGKKTKSAPATKNPAKPKPRTKTQVRKAITGLESPRKPKKQKPNSAQTAMTMPSQSQMMMASMTRVTPMSQETSMGQMATMGHMATPSMGQMVPVGQMSSMEQMASMGQMGQMATMKQMGQKATMKQMGQMGQMATMKQMASMGHMAGMNPAQLACQSGPIQQASMYEYAEKNKQYAQISTATFASVTTPAAPPAEISNLVLTCHRCKSTISGPNATKDMDKHLKDCGSIVCVLCNKKYKSMQTLHAHQLKTHVNY